MNDDKLIYDMPSQRRNDNTDSTGPGRQIKETIRHTQH